jgi:hypothetical protein
MKITIIGKWGQSTRIKSSKKFTFFLGHTSPLPVEADFFKSYFEPDPTITITGSRDSA